MQPNNPINIQLSSVEIKTIPVYTYCNRLNSLRPAGIKFVRSQTVDNMYIIIIVYQMDE